jgi:hypothetical protein
MAGSHIATTPYHHSKRGWTGVGVGLCVSFSLGTCCCRIWFALPIHLILIPDTLHTYKRCLACFICGGWPYCHNTILYHHSASGSLSRGVRSQFLLKCCYFIMISPLIHFILLILILDPLHTYRKCFTYFICGGQLYNCVLTPLSSQYPWPSLEVRCRFLTCIILFCNDRVLSST